MSSYRSRGRRKQPPEPLPLDGSVSITSLRGCSDDPARVNLCVNRRLLGRILIETMSDHGLSVGDAWTAELDSSLSEELERGNAYRAGLRVLSKRAKSAMLLERKLREFGYQRDAIDWSINRLIEFGFLDDEKYAEMLVRSVLLGKPAGRRLLEGKLRQAGIEQGIITRVLDEMLEDRDPLDDARKLGARAARSISERYEPEVRRRRIAGRLARRGFAYPVIRAVLEELKI